IPRPPRVHRRRRNNRGGGGERFRRAALLAGHRKGVQRSGPCSLGGIEREMGPAGSEKPPRQARRQGRERRGELEHPGCISHRRRVGTSSELNTESQNPAAGFSWPKHEKRQSGRQSTTGDIPESLPGCGRGVAPPIGRRARLVEASRPAPPRVSPPPPHRGELGRKEVHSPPITESMVKFRPNVFSLN